MFNVIPLPAFNDNYIWLITQGKYAAVVDPGDADVVERALNTQQLILTDILITHHHSDHIGGVEDLLKRHQVNVYAPKHEQYNFNHLAVSQQDWVSLNHHDIKFNVIEVPGHTLGHVAYYTSGALFCGDTLFSAGCGRLFEGSAQQLYQSLLSLAQLHPETKVYCTHEYTQKNIQFALSIEPQNAALVAYSKTVQKLRAQGLPSLPTSIQQELAVNPFLRCEQAEIKLNLGMPQATDLEIFIELRQRRNNF